MIIKITLTSAESDSGPFDIYGNSTGSFVLISSGIDKQDLIQGYTVTVPDGTTIARVQSTGECTNYQDIPIQVTTTTAGPSPYSLTSNCTTGFITNDYTLTGVPTGATVVVKATFSGYLTRAQGSQYQANATLGLNGTSVVSPCIATQGSFNLQKTETFSAPSNGLFTVSAVATNYSSAVGVNLNIELVSVNGLPVADTVSGCWGNSAGSNGCPA
jgi:hypothetical protein